jgi:hypothetical protein
MKIEFELNTDEIEVSIKVKDLIRMFSEINRLRYHEATTIGLWAIDRNPKKVSHKFIKKESFRIKKLETYP